MDEQRSTSPAAAGKPDPLVSAVADLPRSLEPPVDLWPEIEARLQPRSPFGRSTPRYRVWQQALAALFFMALGAAVTFAVMSRLQTGIGVEDGGSEDGGSEGGTVASSLLPAADSDYADSDYADSDYADSDYATVAWTDSVLQPNDLQLIEAEYLRAKEALWLEVFSQRDQLEPDTWKVVERNLGAIDQAIRQLRHAIVVEPGNSRLGTKLIDTHKMELDLLRRLSAQV